MQGGQRLPQGSAQRPLLSERVPRAPGDSAHFWASLRTCRPRSLNFQKLPREISFVLNSEDPAARQSFSLPGDSVPESCGACPFQAGSALTQPRLVRQETRGAPPAKRTWSSTRRMATEVRSGVTRGSPLRRDTEAESRRAGGDGQVLGQGRQAGLGPLSLRGSGRLVGAPGPGMCPDWRWGTGSCLLGGCLLGGLHLKLQKPGISGSRAGGELEPSAPPAPSHSPGPEPPGGAPRPLPPQGSSPSASPGGCSVTGTLEALPVSKPPEISDKVQTRSLVPWATGQEEGGWTNTEAHRAPSEGTTPSHMAPWQVIAHSACAHSGTSKPEEGKLRPQVPCVTLSAVKSCAQCTAPSLPVSRGSNNTYVCTHFRHNIHIHACTHTLHAHTLTYLHACTHMHTHACTHTRTHRHTHTCMHTQACTHRHTHIHMHTCMHAQAHPYTHTYVHTHISMPFSEGQAVHIFFYWLT